ncbi:MAG: molybdenum cofactor guanylyltransferase [Acidobacteria bacterium]|nr:molybdenum cofactor guanylyltransferase [Acidobacteriota bacterium]
MSLLREEAEGFVLAGGKSSRMGQDKALIEVGGRQLIQHALGILGAAGLTARIAGARSEVAQFAPVVADAEEISQLGPLAGICSALATCRSRFAVFLPVDLPLIPASLIKYLVHHAVVTGSAVTVVSVAGFIQTFPAVVDCAAAESLAVSLHSGDRNCLKAFQAAGSNLPGGFKALEIELLVQPGQVSHPWGLEPRTWFLNINTPDDVRLLEEAISGIVLD